MDPKSTANLDPKLRETYERVMGTAQSMQSNGSPSPAAPSDYGTITLAGQAGAPTPFNQPADAQAAPIPTVEAPPITGQPLQDFPQDPNNAENLRFQAAIQTPLGGAAPEQTTQPSPSTPHQAPTLLRALYIIGAIVFFVVYTFFWIKVFNLPLPF